MTAPDKPHTPRRGEPLAWVVLFLVLAAAGGSVYLWKQMRETEIATLHQQDKLFNQLKSLALELHDVKSNSVNKDALQAAMTQGHSAEDALQNRIAALENQLAQMHSMGTRDRHAWLTAEIGHLLRVADDEARIATNPHAASAALRAADARLRELADTRMTPVRAQIADTLAKLDAISPPDITGMTLTLDALDKQAVSLPLAHRTGRDYAAGSAAATGNETSQSWWQHFKTEISTAFRTMVTIRRDNPDARPLLAPQAEEYLRLNLQLRLAAARVALLQHDQTAFRANLAAVQGWLHEYFAGDDPSVQAVIKTISDMQQAPIEISLPDTSGPLETFRNIQTEEANGR